MRESADNKKIRLGKIIGALAKAYPAATTALTHENPLELLIATILSARCTDERVNKVTPVLFRTYSGARDYMTADQKELEEIIRSTGFFRAKAKSIQGCCRTLVDNYEGRVPATIEELTLLPGVGRKTANVVLGSAFGKAEGVVVDTHVKRLAGRMRLSAENTPEKIELDLMNLVPKKHWIDFSHMLILHGRKICRARKPLCPECPVNQHCPSAEL